MIKKAIDKVKADVKYFWGKHKREIVTFGAGLVVGVIVDRCSDRNSLDVPENGYIGTIVDDAVMHLESWSAKGQNNVVYSSVTTYPSTGKIGARLSLDHTYEDSKDIPVEEPSES